MFAMQKFYTRQFVKYINKKLYMNYILIQSKSQRGHKILNSEIKIFRPSFVVRKINFLF